MVVNIFLCVFLVKQKTAYGMRISYWSSDVCSSDLVEPREQANELIGLGLPAIDERPIAVLAVTLGRAAGTRGANEAHRPRGGDRKSYVSGTRVSVRVGLGVPRIVNKEDIKERLWH